MVFLVVDSSTGDLAHSRSPTRGYFRPSRPLSSLLKHALALAARTLQQRGDGLVLLRPQRVLVRMLEIMGADQMITIRGQAEARPEPEP